MAYGTMDETKRYTGLATESPSLFPNFPCPLASLADPTLV